MYLRLKLFNRVRWEKKNSEKKNVFWENNQFLVVCSNEQINTFHCKLKKNHMYRFYYKAVILFYFSYETIIEAFYL